MYRAVAPLMYDHGQALSPVLVIGDSPHARSRARRTIDDSEFALAGTLSVEEAADELGRTATLSAIWLEYDEAPTAAGLRLLEQVGGSAARLGSGLVVSTRLEHLDSVLLSLGAAEAELLVDAEDLERLGSLSIAATRLRGRARAAEGANEASAARLRQLSEEVGRIAAALARLGTMSSQPPLSSETMAPPREDVPNVSAEALRALIRARRQRAAYLPADLFADPAWDMLLDLLQAEIIQHRVPVSSLCIAAAVPATTALRWIKSMTDRGLLVRRDDPHDGRRVFIEMAPATSSAMRRYFHETGLAGV